MTDETQSSDDAVLETVRATRDAMAVKGVFGEAYELDGVTVIPVARVSGGAGGGGGEGTGPQEEGSGKGFGTGFGVNVQPVGVFEVRDGAVEWKPIVDVNRLARGGQVLGGIVAVCLALILVARRGR